MGAQQEQNSSLIHIDITGTLQAGQGRHEAQKSTLQGPWGSQPLPMHQLHPPPL
jgi:hypothetical protein